MIDGIKERYRWIGFSVKSILLILIGIMALSLYIRALFYGESSLMVLNKLHNNKERLVIEKKELKASSQMLQKQYFELLQLSE